MPRRIIQVSYTSMHMSEMRQNDQDVLYFPYCNNNNNNNNNDNNNICWCVGDVKRCRAKVPGAPVEEGSLFLQGMEGGTQLGQTAML